MTTPRPQNTTPTAPTTPARTVAAPVGAAVPLPTAATTTTTTTSAAAATATAPPAPGAMAPAAASAGASGTPSPTTKTVEEMQKVSVVSTKSQFDIKIAEAGNKLVIVEFYAQWCGPCKIIGNRLEELAGKYENQAIVLKLDVDECEDIAIEYNVTSMPTFVFLRNKKQINQLIGSSGDKLFENVEKLCSEINSTPDTVTSATNVEGRHSKTASLTPNPTVK